MPGRVTALESTQRARLLRLSTEHVSLRVRCTLAACVVRGIVHGRLNGVQPYAHGLRASGQTAMLASGACVRSIAHTLAYVCVTVLACACACMCVCACSGARVCVHACVRARASKRVCVAERKDDAFEAASARASAAASCTMRVTSHASARCACRFPVSTCPAAVQHAACNTQHATRNTQRATRSVQHARVLLGHTGRPNPGLDVAGASPVLRQMWERWLGYLVLTHHVGDLRRRMPSMAEALGTAASLPSSLPGPPLPPN
jgi:hypothetical protein